MSSLKSLDFLGHPHYSVSDDGKVYSRLRYAQRNRVFDPTFQRELIPQALGYGNLIVRLRDESGKRRAVKTVCSLVASAFLPNPEGHTVVKQRDGNKHNNNVTNLEWMPTPLHLKPGHPFVTNQGCAGLVIGRSGTRNNVTVALESETAIESCKRIILVCKPEAVFGGTVRHPYHPTVAGVGWIGLGPHQAVSHANGVEIRNPIYTRWHGMLARCSVDGISDLYLGTSVSNELLDFQIYSELVLDLMRKANVSRLDGFEIDKDIKSGTDPRYARDTLTLVPVEINRFLASRTSGRGVMPLGVCYAPTKNLIHSTLLSESNQPLLKYRTPESSTEVLDCVNSVVDFYIREKSRKAAEVFKLTLEKYPEWRPDSTVVDTFANFEVYLKDVVYPNCGWSVELTMNGRYAVTESSGQRAVTSVLGNN